MKIGNNIRKIRESKNITIDNIVKDLKIFKEKYIKIENNSIKPDILLLKRIAKSLGVTDKDIINYNEEQEKVDKLKTQELELKNLTFKTEKKEVSLDSKITVGNLLSKKPQLLNLSEIQLRDKLNITGVINIKPSESIEVLDGLIEPNLEDELEDEIDPFEGLDYKRGTPFSPQLLNYIEPYFVNGFKKTLFYTEVNSGLKVGDRVFILNGNYDSNNLIKEDKYKRGRDGYKVLFVDKCKVVLDIDYTGILPFDDSEDNEFINVYYVKNQEDFLYVNRQFTTRGGNFDYKFNQFQNNIIYVDNDYSPINNQWGETLGLSGSPGFFVKNGTASWTNITSDFVTGSFSVALSPTYSNNNRVKIHWGSFTYSVGQEVVDFREEFSYKWSPNSKFDLFSGTYSTWGVDSKYLKPILTKGNFRRGDFKGKFNSGVFGSTDEKIEWNNANFNSGTIFNTKWVDGVINSIFTLKESYISEFDELGVAYQKIVAPNNNGNGYNFIINSELDSSIINNANIYNTVIGSIPTYSVVEDYLTSSPINYPNVINKAFLNGVELYGSLIANSELKNTRVFESKLENSKSINSHYKSSLIKESTYISDDIIKISDYSEYNFTVSQSGITHKLYRFFINKTGYDRLKIRDRFYIKNLKINDGSKYPINFFDKRFRLSTWSEYFDDYNSNNFYKRGYETAAFLSTPGDNSFDFNTIVTGTSFSTMVIQPSQKTGYSIDIIVSINDISGVQIVNSLNTNEISPLGLNFNKSLTASTPLLMEMPSDIGDNIDISRAYIVDSDFESGLFESSDWISGYHINYNNDVNITRNDSPINNIGGYYNISINGTNSIILNTLYNGSYKESGELCLSEGNIVYLNNVDYISPTGSVTTLGDTYKILLNNNNGVLTLEEIGTNIIQTLATGGSYSTIGAENRWGYIYKAKFDNAKIRSGLFRRSYIKNSLIENEDYDLTDIDFIKTRRLKTLALSDIIWKNTGNTLSKALYLNSHFVNGSDSFVDGIVYKSIWNGLTFSNGTFKEGRWITGTFEDGLFYNNRSFDSNPNNVYQFYDVDRIKSYYKSGETSNTISNNRYSWQNGQFNNGEFFKSDWEGGEFNNGKFYFSKFYNGNINGGRIGDDKIPTEKTIIYNAEVNFTNVDNAEFFASDTSFNGLSSSTINWYNGVFNKGLFGSFITQSATHSATWYNGIFNGGDFISLAKWKSGTFNGGKFISGFGWTMSDSSNQLDYSWEDGQFNGGNFGNANGLTNSTWYTGEFNGGLFTGRVWNNGIFTNGEFEGSAATYSAIGGVTSSNANEFVVSFTNSYWGIWRNGYFGTEKDKFITNKKLFTKLENASKILRRPPKSTIKDTIWLGGTFSHSNGEMINSVWLDGGFERGKFIESSFNPYVVTDHLIMSRPVYSTQSFNINDTTCRWYNGKLEISDFYYSIWEKGTYTIGDAYGMIWKNGVCEYMNAFNICWQDGLWRNGNWYGSYFNFNGTLSDPFTIEILNRTAECTGVQSLHIWNIFEDVSDENSQIVSASASQPTGFSLNPVFILGPP
jgi:transcriptional regulator with XRE-family HTH domain